MVLGMLLYEGVDIAYNVVRLGYNSVAGVYNWYYQIEEIEEETHKEAKEMIDELKKLNKRVKELEDALIIKKKIK